MDSLGDELAIHGDDPIFQWADDAGIPGDLMDLMWDWFHEKYTTDPKAKAKRYADWRAVFRNSVKGNWSKFLYALPDGGYGLTTVGEAFRRAREAQGARAAA